MKKHMPHSKNRKRNDDSIWRLFGVAIAEGIPASIVAADGRLYDMHGWEGDSIKSELLGYRWLEYIDVRDVSRVRHWLKRAANGSTVWYRGVCPGNHSCECALCKLNGDGLRLITGLAVPSEAMLPAAACWVDDDATPPHNTLTP
jgi:hypothetical protein